MDKFAARLSVGVCVALLLPSLAYAQAAITGVVKDTSGAVLPGVTVEAASPVLIEKVRSVVTDATGQYRIVDLRPGSYTVTFTLPGFSTIRREGIELTGSFVATVNGDLRVGALEETITVTGETPIVDVQSAKTQQTLGKDVIAAIPSSRMASSVQALIPGMSLATDVGGSGGNFSGTAGNIHGGRAADSRSLNDGLDTGFDGRSGGMFMANVGGSQEVVISTSGGLGEAETGGAVLNIIPRDGSNTFSGSFFFAGANSSMQSSNYTQELKDQGVVAPNRILENYDINPMGGGRIIRDRLWFYTTTRRIVADNTVTGMFVNKNAGKLDAWTYEPDTSRPAIYDQMQASLSLRLTWQATARNKVNLYWDEQHKCFACEVGGQPTTAPEATGRTHNFPSRVQQATWTAPVTSRVLLEAGFGTYMLTYRTSTPHTDGSFNPGLWQVTEQAGSIPGLNYRAPASYGHSKTNTRTWRGSLSYVTGSHNMKFGYFGGFTSPLQGNYWFTDISNYRFRNGVPNRLTIQGQGGTDLYNQRNLIPTSFYAQDQWTRDRLTLQGGVRYDHMVSSFPDQRAGGTRLIPEVIFYPAGSVKGVGFDDVTPRMGAAYDLFGNGRTALKVNLGKYMLSQTVQGGDLDLSPLGRLAFNTTRSWNDADSDFVADCNLADPDKNGECGAMANENFGRNIFSTTFDPDVTEGWGNRQYNWEFGASMQHELVPRVSVNVGYHRRWFGNFLVTDNRAVGPADYDAFSFTTDPDPRLPDGGGQTISDLWDVKPEKFGLVDNYRTAAKKFGKQIENWHGVDVNLSARMRTGITMQGGFSTGRTLTDRCDVLPKVDSPSRRFCREETLYLTQVKGFASYTIPRADVQISATLQSSPGPVLEANFNVPNRLVSPSLGRNLAGGESTVQVNLVEPGKLYGDRLNQLDLRFAKIFRFGRSRTQVGVDLYNAINSAVPLGYNETYGASWLRPNAILTARFAKVSVQVDF